MEQTNSMRYFLLCAAMIMSLHNQTVFAQHEGHKMPPATPTATPSPSPSPKPTTSGEAVPGRPEQHPPAHPSPQPQASPQTADEAMKPNGHVHMDHGLFVMHDDQMFIRVGRNESNLIPMGRMGSGTSWQPASTSMPMMHKQSGEWLLMLR